jgi:hypothetical protein|tara:strand:+ start:887 stop:1078 length:192 start_codon:yes stop_codon:yes gene_type:complete
MTQAGIPVLTVHDEFIVRRADRKFLEIAVSAIARQVMEFVYEGAWAEVKAKWETSTSKKTICL